MVDLKRIFFYLPPKIQQKVFSIHNNTKSFIADEFLFSDIGKNYGLDLKDKKNILKKILENLKKVQSATSLNVHLTLLKYLFLIPKNSKGTIVECGTYKGSTAITLSIAANIMKKKLIIYDSFEGLPNGENNIKRKYPHLKLTGYYKKGMYSGTLDLVKKNISNFGFIDNVTFIKGYFNKSLIKHDNDIDFLFLDVDLTSSTYTCIKYLWPYLNNDRYCMSDDACDLSVVQCWFDNKWWKDNLKSKPPGYVGSGCGLNISSAYSSLGYAYKGKDKNYNNKYPWLVDKKSKK